MDSSKITGVLPHECFPSRRFSPMKVFPRKAPPPDRTTGPARFLHELPLCLGPNHDFCVTKAFLTKVLPHEGFLSRRFVLTKVFPHECSSHEGSCHECFGPRRFILSGYGGRGLLGKSRHSLSPPIDINATPPAGLRLARRSRRAIGAPRSRT